MDLDQFLASSVKIMLKSGILWYLVVKDQVFMEATKEGSLTFVVGKFDGILGLGFQEIFVGDVVPVWYKMVEQGLVNEELFSFWVNRDADTKVGGEIIFGGVDSNHFKGEHTYVRITQTGYWQEVYVVTNEECQEKDTQSLWCFMMEC